MNSLTIKAGAVIKTLKLHDDADRNMLVQRLEEVLQQMSHKPYERPLTEKIRGECEKLDSAIQALHIAFNGLSNEAYKIVAAIPLFEGEIPEIDNYLVPTECLDIRLITAKRDKLILNLLGQIRERLVILRTAKAKSGARKIMNTDQLALEFANIYFEATGKPPTHKNPSAKGGPFFSFVDAVISASYPHTESSKRKPLSANTITKKAVNQWKIVSALQAGDR